MGTERDTPVGILIVQTVVCFSFLVFLALRVSAIFPVWLNSFFSILRFEVSGCVISLSGSILLNPSQAIVSLSYVLHARDELRLSILGVITPLLSLPVQENFASE